MRLDEILQESVTFNVAKLTDHNGEKYYSNPFAKEVEKECWVCNGTGKDPYAPEGSKDASCDMCHGSGKTKEWESPAGELNMANANASVLLDALGIDNSDWTGIIHNKDLPALRRKLIKLKNQGAEQMVEPPSTSHGQTRATKDPSGMSRIERGPTMHYGGRSLEQIERYIDALFKIIDFAQKNDLDVVWG